MITKNLPMIYWFQPQLVPISDIARAHQLAILQAGFGITKVSNLNELYHYAADIESRQTTLCVFMVYGLGNETLAALARLRSQYSRFPRFVILSDFNERSILQSLYCGADDYCLESYSTNLWIAKIESVIRCKTTIDAISKTGVTSTSEVPSLPLVQSGSAWHLIEGGWILLSPEGQSLNLTTTERVLCLTLCQQPDYRASHQMLLDAISDGDESQDVPVAHNRLGVVISRLKRKGQEYGMTIPIRSVYKWGYMFGADIKIS